MRRTVAPLSVWIALALVCSRSLRRVGEPPRPGASSEIDCWSPPQAPERTNAERKQSARKFREMFGKIRISDAFDVSPNRTVRSFANEWKTDGHCVVSRCRLKSPGLRRPTADAARVESTGCHILTPIPGDSACISFRSNNRMPMRRRRFRPSNGVRESAREQKRKS